MNAARIHPNLLVSLVCLVSSGCALTSRSDPLPMRYFTAEAAASSGGERTQRSALSPGSELPLRLERVQASSHLEDAIAYRNAGHEVGYYEGERWTERPGDFVERALERALYQDGGLKRVISGASETLVVELTAFEEIRGPQPVARFEAIITLHDERTSQLVQTVRVERPIAPSRAESGDKTDDAAARVVAALSDALQAGVDQIAQIVEQKLAAIAAADPADAADAAVAEEAARHVTH